MKNTYLILTLLVGICFTTIGQNLNSYKYVEVPDKFDFLKNSNQYQLNELTKFLFEKYGFKAYLISEEKPVDWNNGTCDILHANVIEDSGLFKTKLQVELKNCKNELVFTSKVGSSKEKEFKLAYHDALRDAFSSFRSVKYSYNQKSNIEKEKVVEEIEKEGNDPIVQQPKEVIVSAVPIASNKQLEFEKLEPIIKDQKIYVSGNVDFYLRNTKFGYQLFLKQIEQPFAKLVKTKSVNYFIYSTIQDQGIAYFDENGNLIVEILKAQDNSTSVKIYMIRN